MMPATAAVYSADDRGFRLDQKICTEPDAVFELRVTGIPRGAVPVFDRDSSAVIGYCFECACGVYQIYDLDGSMVGLAEVGLEVDSTPVELFAVAGGALLKGARGAWAWLKTLLGACWVVAKGPLLEAVLKLLMTDSKRVRARLENRILHFSENAIRRMKTPGEFVPVHILGLAIKHGQSGTDPLRCEGVSCVTADIRKNGNSYTLQIAFRERDSTVLHFQYEGAWPGMDLNPMNW